MEAQSNKNTTKGASGNTDLEKGEGANAQNVANKKKYIIQRIYDAFFVIMVELLKTKQISQFWACLLTIFMFCQVFAFLFDPEIFSWDDQFFLQTVYVLADNINVKGTIEGSGSQFYYYIFFYFCIIYQIVMALLLLYLHYALQYPQIYFKQLVSILQLMFLIIYSVLFIPFSFAMNSVFKCEGGSHYLLTDVKCLSSSHITLIIISCIGLTFFLSINLIIATLYNETQPVKENALSRLNSNFELIMLAYRYSMSLLSLYCFQNFCSWIIILISLVSSVYFLYQYYKFLPYYNSMVSLVFGSMLGLYTWISLNALLTGIYQMSGHITVILIGSPFVYYTVKYLRDQRIDWLMNAPLEDFTMDIDCLNQIMTFQEWIHESQKSSSNINNEIKVKGFINQHMIECESLECVCSRIGELYDNQTDSYLQLADLGLVYEPEEDTTQQQYEGEDTQYASLRSQTSTKKRIPGREQSNLVGEAPQKTEEIHRCEVFIVNFNRQLYKDALNKFDKSVSIHILFAYYYFNVLRNVHAALHELKIASKKRPNIYQQFTIYRYQNMIEIQIKAESDKIKDVYQQLTNVKEFERLHQEMARQIEKVCNYQLEFWTHLANVIPDLNYLNKLNNQIVDSAAEADRFWDLLCRINPDYPQALMIYSEYLSIVRNNQKGGKLYSDKAEKLQAFGAKGGGNDNVLTSSEILFSEEAVILHISGNKESSGKIMKTSKGLKKCFGFDRQEMNGQNVTILMTNMFANKHNAFLEQYYQTARKLMFNKERSLFAAHKTGYCFQIHLLIKQMPSLTEGIQYVGMIKPQISDNDFILTDMNGYIDSFTSGVGLLFNINPQLVKDSTSFNIQFIAPELVEFFDTRQNQVQEKDDLNASMSSSMFQSIKSFGNIGKVKNYHQGKYAIPGGDTITFYIPNNFLYILKQENTVRGASNRNQKGGTRFNDTHSAMSPSQKGGSPEAGNKQTPIFKEFIKYIHKVSKGGAGIQKREFGHLPQLLQCREYKEYDTKKTLQVEVRELIIPLGNSEDKGVRMLLFKIPKNQMDIKKHDVASFDQGDQNLRNLSHTVSGIPKQQSDNSKSGAVANGNELKTLTTQYQKKVQKTRTMMPATAAQIAHKATLQNINPQQQVQRNHSFTANTVKTAKTVVKNDVSFEGEQSSKAKELSQKGFSNMNSSNPENQNKGTLKFMTMRDAQAQSDPKVGQVKPPELDLKKVVQAADTNIMDEEVTIRIDVKMEITLKDEARRSSQMAENDKNIIKIDAKLEESNKEPITSVQRRFVEDHTGMTSDNAQSFKPSVQSGHVKPSPPKYLAQSHADDSQTMLAIDTELGNQSASFKKSSNANQTQTGGVTSSKPNDGDEMDEDDLEGQLEEWDDDEYGEEFYMDEEYEEEDEFSVDDQLLNSSKNHTIHSIKDDTKSHGKVSTEQTYPQRQKSRSSQRGAAQRQRQQQNRATAKKTGNSYGSTYFRNHDMAAQVLLNFPKDQLNQTNPGIKTKKHDYSKIVTNKKYVCFDEDKESCGSFYLNQCNATESEIDIRETIKMAQKVHMFQRKQTKRTQKVIKLVEKGKSDLIGRADEGELDESRLMESGLDLDKAKSNGIRRQITQSNELEGLLINQDDTGEAIEEVGDNENTQLFDLDEVAPMQTTQASKQRGNIDSTGKDEGEASSIASSAQSQTRTFYSLKLAIDEKFVPLQIRNLRFVANIVWIAVLLLSISYFFIQTSLFQQIQSFIGIIVNSESRIGDIMSMNLKLSDIALLNEGILQVNATGVTYDPTLNTTFFSQAEGVLIQEFMTSTTSLQTAQSDLSIRTSSFESTVRYAINPENVQLQYFDVANTTLPVALGGPPLASNFNFNIWEAVLQVSVYAYNLAQTPMNITHQNPKVKFIAVNSMNSLLQALFQSTSAIVDQSNSTRDSNNQVFLILVISVSGALALSMAFLLPVIRRAKDNKQEVFILLTHKKVEKQIEEQLKRCRNFISKYQHQSEANNDDDDDGGHDNHIQSYPAAIEENAHMLGEKKQGTQGAGSQDEKKDDYMANVKKQRKKWRPMNNNFLVLSLKFLVVLFLIESFFIYTYVTSSQFLQNVSQLMAELKTLISRQPLLDYSLLMQKELIYSNSTETFLYRPIFDVAVSSLEQQNTDYQSFIDLFQSNYGVHTQAYNADFETIMFGNVCNSTITSNLGLDPVVCENLNGGIQLKGTYATVVKFWSDLNNQINDFYGQQRTPSNEKAQLNSQMLSEEQQMMEIYINAYHQYLGQMLQSDIDAAFTSEFASMNTVFTLFVIYIVLIYLVVWRLFMKGLLEELWRAKACLTLLPIETCFRIEEIRSFIYRNSSGFS